MQSVKTFSWFCLQIIFKPVFHSPEPHLLARYLQWWLNHFQHPCQPLLSAATLPHLVVSSTMIKAMGLPIEFKVKPTEADGLGVIFSSPASLPDSVFVPRDSTARSSVSSSIKHCSGALEGCGLVQMLLPYLAAWCDWLLSIFVLLSLPWEDLFAPWSNVILSTDSHTVLGENGPIFSICSFYLKFIQ